MTNAETPAPDPRPPATNVIEALCRVMEDLPGIAKDQESPQGYKYRGIEQVTRHTQALFGRHGVVFVPRVISRDVKEVLVGNPPKPWTQDELEIVYRVYGPGGKEDWIEVGPLWGLGRDNSDKGANKAMTQAYKYALLQALSIGDAKDDADADEAHATDALGDPARRIKVPNAKGGLLERIAARNPKLSTTEAREEAAAHWRAALLPDGTDESISQAEYDALLARLDQPPSPPEPPEPEKAPEPQPSPEPESGPPGATEAPETPESAPTWDEKTVEEQIRGIRAMKKPEVVTALLEAKLSTAGKLVDLQDRLMDHLGLLTAPFDPAPATAAIEHAFPGASQVGPHDVDEETPGQREQRIAEETLDAEDDPLPEGWKEDRCVCGAPMRYDPSDYSVPARHLDPILDLDHAAELPF